MKGDWSASQFAHVGCRVLMNAHTKTRGAEQDHTMLACYDTSWKLRVSATISSSGVVTVVLAFCRA
jgi:hypothetical protein